MRTLRVFALTLLTASPALAQRPTAPVRAAPTQEQRAQTRDTPACELQTPSGLRLAFQECGASRALAGGVAREVEVVEYKDGDDPVSARLHQAGVVHHDIAVRSVGAGDPDDDGDGLPMVSAARRPGRVKVGRVTLRATAPGGIRTLAGMWSIGDVDGDGFPLAVVLQDELGGEGRVALGGCAPVEMSTVGSGDVRGRSSSAVDLTLRCRTAEMVQALDANPYARFIAESQADEAPGETLVEGAPEQLRTGVGGGVQLQGATLGRWSVEWTGDGARQDVAQWTLEVRVERIEAP